MDEFESREETSEEASETTLMEAEPEPDATEKKSLTQIVREKAKAIPAAVKERAVKAFQFAKEHKKEIAAGAAVVVGAAVYVAGNARDNDQLREENERLLEDNAQLADDLEIERGVSGCLASRVVELEDLCDEKDAYFQEMISDGLRHGSSLAGKRMADRKQYLNEE